MAKKAKLPGQYSKSFSVRHGFPVSEMKTSDGLPVGLWERAGDLLQEVRYSGRLDRLDGKWALFIEYIDPELGAHRMSLPHEAVNAIISAHGRIMEEARSDRAKSGSQTRKANGVIPFQKAQEG